MYCERLKVSPQADNIVAKSATPMMLRASKCVMLTLEVSLKYCIRPPVCLRVSTHEIVEILRRFHSPYCNLHFTCPE